MDANYQFIFIDVGYEGRASDGGIWAKCKFQKYLHHGNNPLQIPAASQIPAMQDKLPYYLVGDDAFPLGPHLLKPYPGVGLTRKQAIYNYRLSRARRVVENAFGILTARFRILQRPIELHPDTAQEIVYAACVLHNYLRKHAASDYIMTLIMKMNMEKLYLATGDKKDTTSFHVKEIHRETLLAMLKVFTIPCVPTLSPKLVKSLGSMRKLMLICK